MGIEMSMNFLLLFGLVSSLAGANTAIVSSSQRPHNINIIGMISGWVSVIVLLAVVNI